MKKSVMLSRVFVIGIFVLLDFTGVAQVSNNNIKNRSELVLNESYIHSSTNNASVEWDCVNKNLTNKCLIYHNDQWFHFTPNRNGKFFLNISSQHCRDEHGIQVIVIEGNPCEINTYRIIECIAKIYADDVFIELDSLKQGIQYLVNIDGFLGDFCQFDIQFATFPKGFPRILKSLDTLNMTASKKGSVVTIRWMVDEAIAENISVFRVFRREEQDHKFTFICELPLTANTLGDFGNEYVFRDSVPRMGVYVYRVFGIQKESEYPLLLDEEQVSFKDSNYTETKWASIPLSLKEGESYLVMVFNRADYSLLRKYTGTFDARRDSTFKVNLNEFIKKGISEFIILASETNSKNPKEFQFVYDGNAIVRK